jgi:hypothetical protein
MTIQLPIFLKSIAISGASEAKTRHMAEALRGQLFNKRAFSLLLSESVCLSFIHNPTVNLSSAS